MITSLLKTAGACALLLAAGIAAAQSQRTEHTYQLDDPDNPPPATLADASFRISDTEMHGYIVMRSGDELREEKMVYHRAEEE